MTDLIATEIIDNYLFLGGYTIAIDTKQLKEKGITKVLTVMDLQNGPNYNPEEFIHKRFNITDNSQQNIIQYFGECINFIKGNEKILIHCLKGTSRSATIVIAYLMWYKKWKFEETYDFVKSKRFIYPNKGFREQLKIFEKLLVENNYDIDKINFNEINWPNKNISI